jgi:hypothetical protein
MNVKSILGANQITLVHFTIKLAALCSLFFACYIAIKFASQIPLDLHSFRQTQTALTAYWLDQNGFGLAYETPVAGAPWSIPFEFPLYQYTVVLFAKATSCDLNASGRLVSFIFLVLCLPVIRSINKRLKQDEVVFYVFSALLLSSPVYLYWGRTFMIETAAIFFAVLAIKYFIEMSISSFLRHQILFVVFITISVLQKATTGLPVLAVLSFTHIGVRYYKANSLGATFFDKELWKGFFYFGVPLSIGILWTVYTDHVKELNQLGVYLTSSNLAAWNWGSIDQRFSSQLFVDILWNRIFQQNLAGSIGLLVLAAAIVFNRKSLTKVVLLVAVIMGVLPLFLFTNLHIVHNYYQAGCLVFLVYALSIALVWGYKKVAWPPFLLILMGYILWSNYSSYFVGGYYGMTVIEYDQVNSRDIAIGELLKQELDESQYFVAFGNSWSSSLPYLAERKSFTVPEGLFEQYDKVATNPELVFGEQDLGAVVVCPAANPTFSDLTKWSSKDRNWKMVKERECYISFPGGGAITNLPVFSPAQCLGSLDSAGRLQVDMPSILSINGWTFLSGDDKRVADQIYIGFTDANGVTNYFEALLRFRPDVNAAFELKNGISAGYSRLFDVSHLDDGAYSLHVNRVIGGSYQQCQFKTSIAVVDGKLSG